MTGSRRLVCPLCQDFAVAIHQLYAQGGGVRAASRVICETCGTYNLTSMMAVNLRSLPTESRHRLSAITRSASDQDKPIELTTDSEELLATTPQPDPLEQVDLVLEYLAARTQGGRPTPFDTRRDYTIAHAQGKEGITFILESMEKDGLVEASTIDGEPHYRVTMAGYRYRDERKARRTRLGTGWPKVDRAIEEAQRRLHEAVTAEQFQAVGLLCRETLISLAQAVYDASRHGTLDGKEASPTDAKRMLEAVIAAELGGKTNEEARVHAKAAVQLAVALQHDRTAEFRDAAICMEATAFVTRIIAIVTRKQG